MQDFRNFNDQNLNTTRLNSQGISRLPRNTATTPNALVNGAETPKVSFIKARLNKDNFWNLMFWFGICTGVALSEACGSLIGIVLSIIILPKILTMFNPVTHIGNKHFINSKGVSLNENLPKHLDVVFLVMIVFTAFIFVPFFGSKVSKFLHLTIAPTVGLFFLIPTMYFIFRNCPISILFNKEARCPEVTGLNSRPHTPFENNNWSTSPDPYYRHWGGNIHNRTFKD